MEYPKIGKLCMLQDLPSGSCIMFPAHNSTRIGFIVELHPQERGIIDPNYEGENNRNYPVIYSAMSLRNEDVFYFEDARIVPELNADAARFGMHDNGRVSRALFIEGDELVLQAAKNHDVYRFDVVSGKPPKNHGLSRLYTTRWRIEIPDANGDYQVLAEFSA